MTGKIENIYVVRYSGGDYDSYYEIDIFATSKKSKATKYVTKFNKLLKKWKLHYSQFESKDSGISWIKDEHVEKHYSRWSSLRNINNCFWVSIEIR